MFRPDGLAGRLAALFLPLVAIFLLETVKLADRLHRIVVKPKPGNRDLPERKLWNATGKQPAPPAAIAR